MRKSGLPPVVDENTEMLTLGTLPSDMSIAAKQYYANLGNDLSASNRALDFRSLKPRQSAWLTVFQIPVSCPSPLQPEQARGGES